MTGTVGILNVGAGDIELSFSKDNPAERIRAARIVRDMLRRGFALLIEVEREGVKSFERALDFDEEHCRYIIADYDPTVAQTSQRTVERELSRPLVEIAVDRGMEEKEPENGEGQQTEAETSAPSAGQDTHRRRGRYRKSIDAENTRAVAVGRSAGG